MSNVVGLALSIAILALAAAVALPKIEADQARVGAYQLVPAGIDHIYRIDTTTGDAWISVDGGDWEAIDEASEPEPYKSTASSAHTAARAPVARHTRLRRAHWAVEGR
jgi:hypothetical protein